MDIVNWFNVLALIILLMILAVLWIIKEALEDKKETDAAIIKSTRRFRKFEQRDYYFRKNQRKVNQEIIKKLKNTYNEYENLDDLKEELLGIKVDIKEVSNDYSFIIAAIFSLLLSLIPVFSTIPSAVLLIPSVLIVVAIASYLRELFEKTKMEEPESSIILNSIPIIIIIATIMIMVVLLGNGSSTLDLYLTDWIFRILIMEAIILYLIQIYQKVKYINYLEIVSIVLKNVIMEEDRKLWMK